MPVKDTTSSALQCAPFTFLCFKGFTVIIFNAHFIEEILPSSTQGIFYILAYFYVTNFTNEEIRVNVTLYFVAHDVKLNF
jgi:hypothetical protein